MSGDSPGNVEYELNDFDPDVESGDQSTVLGTESEIDTESGQIAWETYGKDLETLVSYRDSIKPKSVRDMATNWRDHGDTLGALAGQFSNEVQSKIVDSWDSDGGRSASAAVQNYADQLSQLTTVIKAVANSLDFSADFLETTRDNIPDSDGYLADEETLIVEVSSAGHENADTEAQRKQLLTQRANDVMNEVFIPGAKSVDRSMPIFPLPKPVTDGKPPPGSGEGPGGGQQSGGQQSGGQQPGSTGGAPPQPSLDPMEQQSQELAAAQQGLEEQAELQQEALQQQQQELAQQPGSQQPLQTAQQGLQQLGQMGEQLSTAAQQALQQAGVTGLPGMPGLQEAAKNYQSALQQAGKLPPGLGGGGSGGSGPGGSSPALKGAPAPNVEKAGKLFPRASLAGTPGGPPAGVVAAQAGQGAPMGGMPMGGAGGGGAQGGQQKDHKRPDYLDSTEWIEEGIGDAQVTSKPVVDG